MPLTFVLSANVQRYALEHIAHLSKWLSSILLIRKIPCNTAHISEIVHSVAVNSAKSQCTALRRNQDFIAFLILVMWAKRVMSGAGHAFKIFFLSCTAHASLRSARALHPHICKRRCIARGIHAQRTFTCGTPIMNPPAPRKIVHMSILANRDRFCKYNGFLSNPF